QRGAHIAAGDRIPVILDDAPALQRSDIEPVEASEAFIRERGGRAQLASAEGRGCKAALMKVALDTRETRFERNRIAETQPLNPVAWKGRDAARILEGARYV